MNDPMRGNSGSSSESNYEVNHTSNAFNQKDAEDLAKSLMHEILIACQELRLLNAQIQSVEQDIQILKAGTTSREGITDAVRKLRQHSQDLELQSNAVTQKISPLCNDLESVKKTLKQTIQAMELNAQRLESEYLSNPTAELHLKRGAEIARSEAERLKQFIQEIDEVLTQAQEAMAVQFEQLEKLPLQSEFLHSNERQLQLPDLDHILAGFDTARDLPSRNQDFNVSPFLIHKQEPPMLMSAPSQGLEASLGKVPSTSSGPVEIYADPYNRGLYTNDAYSGREELSYDPYDSIAGPMAMGGQHGPIMAQAGFDGSYMTYGPGGVTATF